MKPFDRKTLLFYAVFALCGSLWAAAQEAAPAAESSAGVIDGGVYDAANGLPIAGVTVEVAGESEFRTTTTTNGTFRISVPPGNIPNAVLVPGLSHERAGGHDGDRRASPGSQHGDGVPGSGHDGGRGGTGRARGHGGRDGHGAETGSGGDRRDQRRRDLRGHGFRRRRRAQEGYRRFGSEQPVRLRARTGRAVQRDAVEQLPAGDDGTGAAGGAAGHVSGESD